jgi:hypothetical protein
MRKIDSEFIDFLWDNYKTNDDMECLSYSYDYMEFYFYPIEELEIPDKFKDLEGVFYHHFNANRKGTHTSMKYAIRKEKKLYLAGYL